MPSHIWKTMKSRSSPHCLLLYLFLRCVPENEKVEQGPMQEKCLCCIWNAQGIQRSASTRLINHGKIPIGKAVFDQRRSRHGKGADPVSGATQGLRWSYKLHSLLRLLFCLPGAVRKSGLSRSRSHNSGQQVQRWHPGQRVRRATAGSGFSERCMAVQEPFRVHAGLPAKH